MRRTAETPRGVRPLVAGGHLLVLSLLSVAGLAGGCGPTCQPRVHPVRDPCLPSEARAGAVLTLRWTESCGSPCTTFRCTARVVGVALEVEVLEDSCGAGDCVDLCEVDARRSCTLGPLPEGTYDVYVSGVRSGRISVTADGATSC